MFWLDTFISEIFYFHIFAANAISQCTDEIFSLLEIFGVSIAVTFGTR